MARQIAFRRRLEIGLVARALLGVTTLLSGPVGPVMSQELAASQSLVAPQGLAVIEDGWASPETAWDCPWTHPIKGNAPSGIYHVPGGRYYDLTKPEDCFATDAVARSYGYRRSVR
ncbi:MAG: hypothetical protein ACR2GO_03320 [Candidatus Limnocylindria bacterium]